MNKLTAFGLISAGLLLTGCTTTPMMAGAPGQVRQISSFGDPGINPDDPALCATTISARFFSFISGVTKLRSFRLLTQEHPDAAGCDLLLRFVHPGTTIFVRDEIQAYSAYSGDLLWQGSSKGAPGKYGAQFLLEQLIRDFWRGQPPRAKLDQDKTTGRRVVKADMDKAGLFLLSESSLDGRTLRRVASSGYQSVEAPRSLSAAVAAPPAPLAPATPAAIRSDIDDLPAARMISAKRHAIVIGVERYREKLPNADFAAGDAKLAAEYFKRVLGIPDQNVALLVDEHATKSDFEKYFERWLPNRVEAGDEVYIYFSGHGSPNPAKGDAYLVPYDGDPTYIDQTGYAVKRMYEQLAKLPAKSVVVAMDSCFSGAGGHSVLAKGARPLVTVSAVDALPAKITVLAASAGDQISNSYQEKGHGLFTYFLLRGLKERGPNVKGVFEYLQPEVVRTARRELNSDQEPQWREGK